jgi:hypothetical protein
MFCDVESCKKSIYIIVAFVSLCVSRVRNRGAPTAVIILVYGDDLFKLKKTKIIERDEQIHQDAFLLGAALKNTVCSS